MDLTKKHKPVEVEHRGQGVPTARARSGPFKWEWPGPSHRPRGGSTVHLHRSFARLAEQAALRLGQISELLTAINSKARSTYSVDN